MTQTAATLASRLGEIISKVNLSAVKRVTISYDPFMNCAVSARQFAYAMTTKRIKETNQSCAVKTVVKSDRSNPQIDLHFDNGHEVLFKTENLKMLEITSVLNELCETHSPKQTVSSSPLGALDGSKKKGKAAKKR